MASFVREVLSAAGTLGEKEDLAGKMVKIRKKLLDLKSQLQSHIEARYGSFSSSLAATSLIASQLERLREEVQQLETTIGKHYKTELVGCNQELHELNSALQELTLTLQVGLDVSGSMVHCSLSTFLVLFVIAYLELLLIIYDIWYPVVFFFSRYRIYIMKKRNQNQCIYKIRISFQAIDYYW
jgi:hypothetical protein